MKQKAIRKLAFNFCYWMGWPKSLFRYKSQRQQELKTDHNKTGGMIYRPASLLKGSQGTSSPACLIHRARRASIFSFPPPYWRVLLEAVSKARLNAFGGHSHINLALLSPGRYTATAQAALPNSGDISPSPVTSPGTRKHFQQFGIWASPSRSLTRDV